ncbi:MAG TPA: hypothetical protein DD477_09155 [Spirochaetaceae bacterium]|nr:hypothetical protein [Spirochaetaceae bacterium]HAW85844.1 hypothetical protein [Spirochaetaceae bacterium]HAX37914.1 hypothetical protein [Spirochaetaceae bacterium]HBO41369.1 hypothetical protein [Spirochaetaceae bacterium]HCQ86566.1 hypothetical protein [Spirochaetaceae bacterium]
MSIRFTLQEQSLCLDVDDDGTGLAEPVAPDAKPALEASGASAGPSGFGLMLVRMLASQLLGNFSITNAQGTHCRVEIPSS